MQEQEVQITCQDQINLAATLFHAEESKAAVMIGPATGIKRQFYAAFAKHLAENGFSTLTFDNRGIAESKQGGINEGNPSLRNWGKQDMTAALEVLKDRYPNVDYHLIGHSAGGQLVGLMENAQELKSIFNFGSSSGSLHYAKYPFKIMSYFFLRIYIPFNNLLFGHTKSQWVGMGEPLPKEVGKEWSRWCSHKGYVKVDLDTKIKEHYYHQLELDSLWVHASDDSIANTETVNDMIEVFPKIKAEIKTVIPDEYGFKDIGHMKFFSKRRSPLWILATDWLNKHSSK